MRITKTIVTLLAVPAICAMPAARAESLQTSTTGTAAAVAATTGKAYELDIDGTKQWVDTNVDLRAGEKLHITSSGTVTYPAGESSKSKEQSFGPDGLTRGWTD